MSGRDMVTILIDSHTAVLRTRGIVLAPDVIEEMARNAAGILHAQLQAEAVPEAIEREAWASTWSPAP